MAAELARTLDAFKAPAKEKGEVLGAFATHKGELTEDYVNAQAGRSSAGSRPGATPP